MNVWRWLGLFIVLAAVTCFVGTQIPAGAGDKDKAEKDKAEKDKGDKDKPVKDQGDKAKEAEEAGADVVGAEDLAQRIQDGFDDFDVAIATPDLMPVVGRLGRILGPARKMPMLMPVWLLAGPGRNWQSATMSA